MVHVGLVHHGLHRAVGVHAVDGSLHSSLQFVALADGDTHRDGVDRVATEEAGPGEIVALAGIPEVTIGETIADPNDPRAFMRGVFRDGLAPALRFDAVVLRAFIRNVNLLSPPDALLKDQDVMGRILAIWNDRENRPPEPRLGPTTRGELVQQVEALAS
mgnify:CR=1 FL=1